MKSGEWEEADQLTPLFHFAAVIIYRLSFSAISEKYPNTALRQRIYCVKTLRTKSAKTREIFCEHT